MATVVGFVYLLLLLVTVFSLQTQCIFVCYFTFSPVLLVWLCRGYSVFKSRCWVFTGKILVLRTYFEISWRSHLWISGFRESKKVVLKISVYLLMIVSFVVLTQYLLDRFSKNVHKYRTNARIVVLKIFKNQPTIQSTTLILSKSYGVRIIWKPGCGFHIGA